MPPHYERRSGADFSVVVSPRHGDWIRELAVTFELVWASTWGERGAAIFGDLLRLPPMPVVPLERLGPHGTRKLPAVEAFVGSRPCGGIDDELYDDAFSWGAQREVPTCLVRTSGSRGLSRTEVDALIAFGQPLDAEQHLPPTAGGVPSRPQRSTAWSGDSCSRLSLPALVVAEGPTGGDLAEAVTLSSKDGERDVLIAAVFCGQVLSATAGDGGLEHLVGPPP